MSRRVAKHPCESMDLEQLEDYVRLLERTWDEAYVESNTRADEVRQLCGRKPESHHVDLFVDVPGKKLEAQFWADCARAVEVELELAEERLWALEEEAEQRA